MAQHKVTWASVKCTAERPTTGAKLIITRAKAKQLLEILTTEFKLESQRIVPAIKRELEHGSHDTHIGFYVDDNDADGFIALQCASMQLTFNLIDYYDDRDQNDKPFNDKECSVCPYCDPERINCSHRKEVC